MKLRSIRELCTGTDLSIYQGAQLLPDGPGRDRLTSTCFGCHGFQSRMAAQVRDETGWRDRVITCAPVLGTYWEIQR